MMMYRCSECKKPIGPMLEIDGVTPRMFVCPRSHRAAKAVKCDSWGLVVQPAGGRVKSPYKLVFDRPEDVFGSN